VLRRIHGAAKGAAHEVLAGSGYWSQDSATAVLTGEGDRVWVRWPGGKETVVPLPPQSSTVVVDFTAK
jgi:hypothetical protein